MNLEGVYYVLATPFQADGTLDRDGLRALVRAVLAAGDCARH
jgi:dihydrodipicolinate synthase/N-acetylneuraminate lyase